MQPPQQFQSEASSNPSADLSAQPTFVPAGFWIRFVAAIIDWVIVFIAQTIVLLPFPEYHASFNPETAALNQISIPFLLLSLAISWVVVPLGYYGWFYKNKGGTPGKLLLGLRVLKSDTGTNLSYLTTWLREIPGKFLSAIILCIGFILAGLRSDKKALHDLMMGTQVVRKG